MIKSIALANLVASPRNVRRSSDETADAQLAADIAARGLLQNLVVTPTKPKGMFAVEAGGRRLRALHKLQFDGVLEVGHKVPCLVLGKDEGAAIEAGLAENFQRLAMNPADECLAFGKLIEDGADVAGVARRFGLTVRFVEGRLRLANLAPQVFEALGAGHITLDAAKAYAATSDRERQAWVFEQLGTGYGAHPDSIRRMMVNATVPASDRRFRFVGEDAYVAAGGRIERDLFEDESQARLLDVAILERLAIDKLDAEAERRREELGYGFVRPALDAYIQTWAYPDLRRVPVEPSEPSEEERREIDALSGEIEDQVAVMEDPGSDPAEVAAAEAKIADLGARMHAIRDKPVEIDPALKPQVGAFLLLAEDGAPRLDRTIYQLVADEDGADDGVGQDEDDSPAASGAANGANAAGGVAPCAIGGTASSELKPVKLAQRLVDELAIQRRDILALHVAADPELALDVAVVLMVADEGGYAWDGGSTLSARRPSDPVMQAAMPPVCAAIAEAKARAAEALNRSWLVAGTMAARFDAFRRLPREQRDLWLGHAVARTLEASVLAGIGRTCAFHDHLGGLLGIDVAQWWRPTARNWFDRVAKAQCLAAFAEIGADELGQRYAKAKKPEVADACERVFAGTAIVDAEVRDRALGWVPQPMRFDDGAPPWDEEAQPEPASEGSDEPDTKGVAIVISDEHAIGDVAAAARDGEDDLSGDAGDGAASGAEPKPAETGTVEPFAVRFVPDSPDLKGVAFSLGDGGDEADGVGEDEVDRAADDGRQPAHAPFDIAA